MEYIEFVDSKWDIIKNIKTIEKYLDGNDAQKEYALKLIKGGTCFVAYKERDDEIRFAPSKFLGYLNNTMQIHESNDAKDGRDTNREINRILGYAPKEDLEMEAAYLKYCNKLFITPRAKGAFGAKRKYWRLF